MTEPTLKQWKRRALAAEQELTIITKMRKFDKEQELEMARELAACKVALKESKDVIDWALGATE